MIPLEQVGSQLGAALWKLESETVEALVAKAAVEETRLEKEKEDLRKEKLVNKNKEKEKDS